MIAKTPDEPVNVNAYGYARVSTDRQAAYSLSLDGQDDAIKRYHAAKLAPFGIPLVEVAIEAVSASKVQFGNRQHGGRLLELLKAGDHLIIAKLDRAFRDLADCSTTLHELIERKVVVHIVQLGMALESGNRAQQAISMLIIHVLAAAAEFESAQLSARIIESNARRRSQGLYCGGPIPIGFKLIGARGRKRLAADDGQREVLEFIAGMVDGGNTYSSIETYMAKQRLMRKVRDQSRRDGYRLEFWSRQAIQRAYIRLKQIEKAEAEKAARSDAGGDAQAGDSLGQG